jgi:DNA-binding CsgD family transcriptional regulator
MEPFASMPIRSPLLVGRAAEVAALHHRLADACAGHGMLFMIAGEAGVGKSRLVATAVEAARARGLPILQGSCFEPDRAIPYSSLIDLLRTHLGPIAPNAVPEALGPLAPHLLALLPEYAALLPQTVITPPLDPQLERQRMTQAFVHFFTHHAQHAPLLVAIEDLHWSDEATLAVLLALARRIEAWPLLLITTCRDEPATPDLTAFVTTLERERRIERIHLAPLDYEQTDGMLRAIFNQRHPIRGDFLAALYQLTDGNPFFIEEVLTSLIAHGDIFRVNDRWERKPLAELQIPPSIQAAVQQRLALLTPPARHLVSLAAVAGRRFDFELLHRLTDNNETALLAQIRELIAAQLIVEESADLFAFRHALTRAALYAGLLARERRTLHHNVATTLAAILHERGAQALEQSAADLAHHCAKAADWAGTLRYARQAAIRAERLYAPAAAVEQLTCAIDAAQHLGLPSPDLLRTRGAMHDTLGRADAALADYEAALAQARHANNRKEEWQILLAIGFFHASHDYALMGDYLRRALELARTLGEPALLGQSLNRYGNWFLFREQPRDALRYHEEALAIFAAAGDPAGLATTHDLLGVTHIMGIDKLAAVAHYQRAIDLFRELDDRVGLASALATVALRGISFYHTTTTPARDGYDAWVRDGEAALQIARAIGWRAGEANALVYLTLIHGAAGDYMPAFERVELAEAIAHEIAHQVWIAGALLGRGALLFDLLALAEARTQLEAALATAAGLGLFFSRRAAGYLALICIAQRDTARAAAVLAPLLDADTAMETQGQRIDWVARAELALAEGDAPLALQIAEHLIATAPHAAEPGSIPTLWLLLGKAHVALGHTAEAEAALMAAADGAARLGLLPLHWRVLHSLGRFYFTAGRRTQARGAYADARTIVTEIAARIPDAALRDSFVRAAAAMLPRQTATAAPIAPAVANLTRREREVAALIAGGRTNREIATTLVLGERTVETHISNILGKLSLTSRREIAAWAIEHGLARRVE